MKKRKSGFTLVEIMVVIALIGVILGLTISSYISARKNARDGRRRADLEQVRSALEMYRSDAGRYPTANPTNYLTSPLSYEGNIYLAKAPSDPNNNSLSNPVNYYYRDLSASTYVLCARLEMGIAQSDCLTPTPALICGVNGCGGYECNYAVCNP